MRMLVSDLLGPGLQPAEVAVVEDHVLDLVDVVRVRGVVRVKVRLLGVVVGVQGLGVLAGVDVRVSEFMSLAKVNAGQEGIMAV